jgi:hypothetical protein
MVEYNVFQMNFVILLIFRKILIAVLFNIITRQQVLPSHVDFY